MHLAERSPVGMRSRTELILRQSHSFRETQMSHRQRCLLCDLQCSHVPRPNVPLLRPGVERCLHSLALEWTSASNCTPSDKRERKQLASLAVPLALACQSDSSAQTSWR